MDRSAEILERVRAGRWYLEWVVISQIVKAPRADILVSESSSSRVEITAKGDAKVGEVVQRGNVDAAFQITSQSGKVANFLNSENVTPLFQSVGLKRRLLGRTRVTTMTEALEPDSISGLTLEEIGAGEELYLDLLR
jgi:hypothetical protein